MFEDLLRGWDGEEVAVRFDAATGTWMLVCVHSTRLGPAAGGTRMKVYASPHDALQDGLRLAGAMTRKNAVADLPLGGGKAVLAVPEIPTGERRGQILLRYADLVASLGGTYWTACDMNTSETDMDLIATRCGFVFGRSVQAGGSGSSAPATAAGVFHGIRASVAHLYGSPDLVGKAVVIQGVGAVGRSLAEHLSDAGARLILADVLGDRATEVAASLDAEAVSATEAMATPCDVFSPCATGGVLTEETIPRLRCRIVAGAANNQLADPTDAERLADAGILYAPDFVINAGGIISLASLELLAETAGRLDERLLAIGDTLVRLYGLADERRISTDQAAELMAQERLSTAA